jgi:hypothetical protein
MENKGQNPSAQVGRQEHSTVLTKCGTITCTSTMYRYVPIYCIFQGYILYLEIASPTSFPGSSFLVRVS